MRTPVERSTSTIAQVQNAWSSSQVRSRRFPVAGSLTHTFMVGLRVTDLMRVFPPTVNGSPAVV